MKQFEGQLEIGDFLGSMAEGKQKNSNICFLCQENEARITINQFHDERGFHVRYRDIKTQKLRKMCAKCFKSEKERCGYSKNTNYTCRMCYQTIPCGDGDGYLDCDKAMDGQIYFARVSGEEYEYCYHCYHKIMLAEGYVPNGFTGKDFYCEYQKKNTPFYFEVQTDNFKVFDTNDFRKVQRHAEQHKRSWQQGKYYVKVWHFSPNKPVREQINHLKALKHGL